MLPRIDHNDLDFEGLVAESLVTLLFSFMAFESSQPKGISSNVLNNPIPTNTVISDSTSTYERSNHYITTAEKLYFSITPCPSLNPNKNYEIPVRPELKRLSESMKWSMIAITWDLGTTN